MKQALSFKSFILRSEVLRLYRDVFRKSKGLERDHRKGILQHARHEFDSMRHITEPAHIRELLREGKRQVEYLEQLRNMTH
mmetsp:Transcript_14617/g.20744  ORF Transcript_14617/g.20744 Transcript_14617/m.20744 type:complete len:81 (-) Transcript_14617:199-441(-)